MEQLFVITLTYYGYEVIICDHIAIANHTALHWILSSWVISFVVSCNESHCSTLDPFQLGYIVCSAPSPLIRQRDDK
jgi:hypothetical protein